MHKYLLLLICRLPVRSPSLLFINRVYPPDRGATGRCLYDVATRLTAIGWHVTILADGSNPLPAPSVSETITQIRVRSGAHPATWPDTPAAMGKIRLARAGRTMVPHPGLYGYLGSFARLLARGLTLPRHDIVITLTDPPLLALLGLILAARMDAQTVHWCHDLYPHLFPVLGLRFPPLLYNGLHSLAASALRRTDRVVAIGACMAERLCAMGVSPERLCLQENWPDPRIAPTASTSAAVTAWRHTQGLEGRFIVAYAGTFGLAHPLDAILVAAARLITTHPQLLFVLIGDGRQYAALTQNVRERNLTNIRLLPFQPAPLLSACLGAADLHLACMNPAALGLLVPSKVAGALAAGRPCLFLGPPDSAAARLITAQGAGAVLSPDDGDTLAAHIAAIADHPPFWQHLCQRASATPLATAETAAATFSTLLHALLAQRTPMRYVQELQ